MQRLVQTWLFDSGDLSVQLQSSARRFPQHGLHQANELKPWLNESWVIPSQANTEFVCQIEEVVQLYTSACDPDYPLACFDESSKQLISERIPLPPAPRVPERFNYEYQREGVGNLFVFFEPLAGWRHIAVTNRHTQARRIRTK